VTNTAFGNSTQPTVILLDEVSNIVHQIPILTTGGTGEKHTVLSYALHLLATQVQVAFVTPLCLCAGTTDGKLVLLSDRTPVVPRVLSLPVFTMKGVFMFGKQLCSDIWPETITKMKEDYLLLTIINYSCQVPRLLKLGIQV